jgi:hypothetical protein
MNDVVGIKIGIEGEKEYKNALTEINSSMKVLRSEMAAVSSEFSKSDKSVESASAKNRVLTKEIETQKDKITTLKEALQHSAESFGENDKRTQAWQTKLNYAQADLNKMEQELDENNKVLETNGKSLEDNSKALNEYGENTDEAGEKTSSFGQICKEVFTAQALMKGIEMVTDGVKAIVSVMKDAVIGAANYADEMLALSTKTGLSTKTLQEFSAVQELIDVDLNTFTSSLSKNTKSMSDAANGSKNASEAYKKLGVSVTDSSGSLRSSEEVFWQSIDALATMTNETERDAVAMQLFGKSAQELNPLIAQGSEGFAELSQKAHEMGLVMSDEALGALGDLDDAMNTWNGTIKGITNALAAELAPELSNIINAASETAQAFAGFISSIGKDDGSFEANLESLKTSVGNFFKVFSESESTQKILGWGLIISGAIIALAPLIGAAVSLVMAVVTGAVAAWPIALLAVLIGGLILFWPQISEWFSNLWNNIKTWGSNTWNNITKWFTDLRESAVSKASEIITGIIDWFKSLPKKIKDSIAQGITNVKEWGTNMIAKGKEAAQGLFNSIVDKIQELPGKIKEKGTELIMGLWNGINDKVQWIKDKITDFCNKVTGWFKDLFGISSPSKLFKDQIGKNLALGLGDGFTDEMKEVAKEMEDAVPTKFEAPEFGDFQIPKISTNLLNFDANELEDFKVDLGQNNSNSSYSEPSNDSLISAFQSALSGMAFKVDGDKIGELVVSKVEKVVFA